MLRNEAGGRNEARVRVLIVRPISWVAERLAMSELETCTELFLPFRSERGKDSDEFDD